jgi:hypothetical protein
VATVVGGVQEEEEKEDLRQAKLAKSIERSE